MCKDCGGSSICQHGRVRSSCKDCGGGSGVLMNRPPPRGAPWELVRSVVRPYLLKGRSHAHVKWRLCDRLGYGLHDCRTPFSLDSGVDLGLLAIVAPCEIRGAHVNVYQSKIPRSRQFRKSCFALFRESLCQVTSKREHGRTSPPPLVNPPDQAPMEGETKKPPDEPG